MLNKILDVTRKITNIIVTFLYKESKSFFISFACFCLLLPAFTCFVTVQPTAELLLHPPRISRLRRGAVACYYYVFARFAQ